MPTVDMTMDEVMYLENTLRMVRGTGLPTKLDAGEDGKDLAQSILDKLETVF